MTSTDSGARSTRLTKVQLSSTLARDPCCVKYYECCSGMAQLTGADGRRPWVRCAGATDDCANGVAAPPLSVASKDPIVTRRLVPFLRPRIFVSSRAGSPGGRARQQAEFIKVCRTHHPRQVSNLEHWSLIVGEELQPAEHFWGPVLGRGAQAHCRNESAPVSARSLSGNCEH